MDIKTNYLAELLISSSPEGILIVDTSGVIRFVNAALVKMFDYDSEEELIGNAMEMLVPKEYSSTHVHDRNTYSNHPGKRKMGSGKVLYGVKKNGDKFAVEIGLNYINAENGILISAIVSDISERVEIQQKLTDLNARLEHKVNERTEELEHAILELREANKILEEQFELTKKAESDAKNALQKEKELGELKSRFVSMASHEFRTPLSTVLSSNILIQKYIDKIELLNEETRGKIDKHNNRITSAIQNLNNILNDLLSLGKIEEGKITTNKAPFSLPSLFDELKEEMATYLKPGQIINMVHKGEKEITSDRQLLYNIMVNLTSNASKYSGEGKKITIASEANAHSLSVSVMDEGIGIPPEDYQHMFDRFFRAKNASNIQGTGLGLNIVKKYLELIDGTINFTSEQGKGTSFTIHIKLT